MASRRFIRKFDRLNADAQQHLERQIDVLHDLGFTRPVEAPTPRVSNVIPFPALVPEEPRPAIASPRVLTLADLDDLAMAKATINDALIKYFNFPMRRLLHSR